MENTIIISTICALFSLVVITVGDHPPVLVTQPDKEIGITYFDWHPSSLVLKCEAEADPIATYRWTKNGLRLKYPGTNDYDRYGNGELLINEHAEGVYQCLAYNPLGIALSHKVVVKVAYMDYFPWIVSPEVLKAAVGDSVIMRCRAPNGYPKPQISWIKLDEEMKMIPVEEDQRVAIDLQGNLYFSSVKASDAKGIYKYLCMARSKVLRSMVTGETHILDVQTTSTSPSYKKPELVYSSPENDTALMGSEVKKLKCIFSGYPTPTVMWKRTDADLPDKVYLSDNHLELIIPDVNLEDEGTYECSATNIQYGQVASRIIHLNVMRAPVFLETPDNVEVDEGDYVKIMCTATGKPQPTVTWTINGSPLDPNKPDPVAYESHSYPRVLEKPSYLIFEKIRVEDTSVVQCNATNQYGYAFTNAYINVKSTD